MERVLNVERFAGFNGYYTRRECRPFVHALYRGKCVHCTEPVVGNDYHVAHIVPRSYPELMERYFPGLDVNNLLNLRLSCGPCNLKERNFVLDTPVLQHAFHLSAQVIVERFDKVAAKLQPAEPSNAIRADDPLVCQGIVHLDVEQVLSVAGRWRQAVVIQRTGLIALLEREAGPALAQLLSFDVISAALREAFDRFSHHLSISGSSMFWSGQRGISLAWADESLALCRLAVRTRADGHANVETLPDGDYVDYDNLVHMQGMRVPIRTETQRWFFDIFTTLQKNWQRLDTFAHKRFLVLGESAWENLLKCVERLEMIRYGIRDKSPMARPEVVAQFSVYKGELHMHGDPGEVAEDIRALCRNHASENQTDFVTVMRKAALRAWLRKAFRLALSGARQVHQPDLVYLEGVLPMSPWVPALPFVNGLTRAQVQAQREQQRTRRGKRGRRTANQVPASGIAAGASV